MINTRKRLINFTVAFSAIELVFGVLIQTTVGTLNTVLSFLSVVLACAFTGFLFTRTKDYLFTQIALVFTVLADLFLVVIADAKYRSVAMVFFSVTQICYFLRIYFNQTSAKEKRLHIILRTAIVITALVLTVIVLKDKTDFLSLISLFYYANLIMNIVFAFTQSHLSLVLPIGLLLFSLCDLFVGLSVLEEYISVSGDSLLYKLMHPTFNVIWLFYVPSQTLVALSASKSKLKEIEEK